MAGFGSGGDGGGGGSGVDRGGGGGLTDRLHTQWQVAIAGQLSDVLVADTTVPFSVVVTRCPRTQYTEAGPSPVGLCTSTQPLISVDAVRRT